MSNQIGQLFILGFLFLASLLCATFREAQAAGWSDLRAKGTIPISWKRQPPAERRSDTAAERWAKYGLYFLDNIAPMLIRGRAIHAKARYN